MSKKIIVETKIKIADGDIETVIDEHQTIEPISNLLEQNIIVPAGYQNWEINKPIDPTLGYHYIKALAVYSDVPINLVWTSQSQSNGIKTKDFVCTGEMAAFGSFYISNIGETDAKVKIIMTVDNNE